MSENLILRVMTGPHKGRIYYFPARARCTIGRASDCFVRLVGDFRDETISRHHCILDINLPQITLRDLNSLNGTRVNGDPVKPPSPFDTGRHGVSLHNFDEIEVGDCALRIEMVPEGPDTMLVCEEEGVEDYLLV